MEHDEHLLMAAYAGNSSDTKYLVTRGGADVDVKDRDGQTPLILAALRGHVKVVEFLVDHGADVEAENRKGQTPLSNAAANGRLEVVRFLVRRGANVDTRDELRRTPLSLAATWENLEVVKFLEGIAARRRLIASVGNLTKSAARR